MASSMSEYKNYLIYSKICVCKKDLKIFKILLSYYDESSWCILLNKEKNKFLFICTFCNSFNQINFDEICNKYTVRMLKNLSIARQIQEKEKEMLQKEMWKLKIQEFWYCIQFST